MKVLFSIFVFGLVVSLAVPIRAQSSDENISSDAIIELADNGNVTDFLRAVGKLEQVAPYIAHKHELLSYLRILPVLQSLGRELNVREVFGGDPLSAAARSITSGALKWLRIDEDRQSDINVFIRFAPENNVYRFLDNHMAIFRGLEAQPSQFEKAYKKFMIMISELEKHHQDLGLVTTARNFFGTITASYMRIADVGLSDLEDLMFKVSSEDAYKGFANFLRSKGARTQSSAELKKIYELSIKLLDLFDKAEIILPTYLYEQTTQTIANVVLKLFGNGVSLPSHYADQLFKRLEIREVQLIADDIITTPWDLIQVGSKPFVTRFLEKVADLYDSSGMFRQKRLVDVFLGKLLLLDKMDARIEGIYRVKLNQLDFVLTAFRTSSVELNVVLHADHVSYGMVEPYYDRKAGEIVVDRFFEDDFSPGPAPEINYQIRIKSFDGKTLRANFTNGIEHFTLNARKIANILDLSKISEVGGNSSPAGTYRGSTDDTHLPDMQLIVTERGPTYSGTVVFNGRSGGSVRVPFSNGYYDRKRQVLYLTSSETNSGNVIHIRGKIRGNRFQGIYLAGGKLKVTEINLRKQ